MRFRDDWRLKITEYTLLDYKEVVGRLHVLERNTKEAPFGGLLKEKKNDAIS
jgi:hypothetical protein